MHAQWVGRERVYGRQIVLAELGPDWRWPLQSDVEWLTLFVAADADDVESGLIRSFAEDVLRHRCAYLSAWGQDSGRVETIFDDVYVSDSRHRYQRRTIDWSDEIPFLMTTSHERESLASALSFALVTAFPDMESLSLEEALQSTIVVLAEQRCLGDVRAYLVDQERLERDADEANRAADADTEG
jgi:hypothetical protein